MFDFAIVGAGSAGSVLAERLSASGRNQVVLIEAGGSTSSFFVSMPMGLPFVLKNPKLTRAYQVPIPSGHEEVWVRGRGLGGTSAVNGMVYTRGQREDFADWEAAGAAGWGWGAMQTAFEAIEHGGDEAAGKLNISSPESLTPLSKALLRAGRAMGLPINASPNGPEQFGMSAFERTIHDGRRMSAADAFLSPAMHRPNLTVRTNAFVQRILFSGNRAIGVLVSDSHGKTSRIDANEIIICAGTIQSPMILQHSGIGNPHHLGKLGIGLVASAPDVGRNLREHRIFTLQYFLNNRRFTSASEYKVPKVFFNVAQYLASRRGVMANLAYEVAAFVKSDARLARPDAELVFLPYALDLSASEAFEGKMKFSKRPGVQIVGCPLRPLSTGTIEITCSDPAAPPRIDPNYLSDAADVKTAVNTFRFIRNFMAHPSLVETFAEEGDPGPAVADDENAIAQFILRHGKCGLHAVGTCRMGDDPNSVVDTQLRVRGVAHLRVVDCSVMPTMISGHTNGPAMALAWRAANVIQQG